MNEVKLIVKLVIFSVIKDKLQIFTADGFLPETDLSSGQSLDTAAGKLFTKIIKLPLSNNYLEQLFTISDTNKGLTEITVVYYVLIPWYLLPKSLHNCWSREGEAACNPMDIKIIKYAVQRLQWKIEYTNVVYSLLPEEFTFGQLQTTYEAILGRELDKRNFRKKILSLDILNHTGKKRKSGKAHVRRGTGRPAETFSFKKRKLTFVEVL